MTKFSQIGVKKPSPEFADKDQQMAELIESVATLQQDLFTINQEFNKLTLQSVFGDFARKVLEEMFTLYENETGCSFTSLMDNLACEHRQWRKKSTNSELVVLLQMSNHKQFQKYIEQCDWTVEEYLLLSQFSRERNISFHSSYQWISSTDEKKKFLHSLSNMLNDPELAPYLQQFQPVLQKPIVKILANLNEV